MSDYFQNIIDLRINNKKTKYENELKGNKELTQISINFIQNEITNLNLCYQKVEEKVEKKIENTQSDVDNLVYNRYWHKLKPFHQKVKLREFVENLTIKNDKKKN